MALQNLSQLFSPSFLRDSELTKTLGEEIVLCEHGNIIFHWADFFETCDLIKSQLENNPSLMSDFKLRVQGLKRLSLIPVWIRTDSKVIQTTMFDLYEKYILNQIQKLGGGVDPFCPLEISFISGTGPFKNLSIAECFNKATYRDFILVYLLQEKLPRRDYRIRLKSKILMEYGHNYSNAELISLEQLTTNGLLLSMDSDIYMHKVQSSENIRLLINTKMLAESAGKSLEEMKNYLSQYSFNLLYSSTKSDSINCFLKDFSVQSSFDFAKNKKVYLFGTFDKLSKTNSSSVFVIRDFVNETKNLVREHYQKSSSGKKTA